MNPVEQRLHVLCEHWVRFRDDRGARVLIWRMPDSARRLVECFVAMQAHEVPYASGDVLVALRADYRHYLQYGRDTKVELRGRVDASADDLRAQGLPPEWSFDPASTADTPHAFAAAMRLLGSAYHRHIGHLAAVLLPKTVADASAFTRWLHELVDDALPERLRVLVFDRSDAPQLSSLDAHPAVRVQSPLIDSFAMAQETFAQEPTTGPAGVYRNLMIGTLALIEKGSADAVKAKAADALAFARKQGWHDQEVALRIAVAGALTKEQRFPEALRVYENALRSAEKTAQAGHPAGLKLVLQTWFGQGGVHLAAGNSGAAAACYERAAQVAASDKNLILEIEAHRMTGWCLARAGRPDEALAAGRQAMRATSKLGPEARMMTTAPIAMGDLLRAADPRAFEAMQAAKADVEDDLGRVQRACEEHGRMMARSNPAEALAVVEAQRTQGADAATARALDAFARIASSASDVFRVAKQQGDELLGPRWLVDSDAALPAWRAPPPDPSALEAAA